MKRRFLFATLLCVLPLIAAAQTPNTFAPTGSMTTPRFGHTATLLASGKVLVAGGQQAGAILATAELYDPATGLFTSTASMATDRTRHTATSLSDGRVLIAGGFGLVGGLGVAKASAEIYDPATGTFQPTGSMSAARQDHTATLLPNGKVLITGGVNATGILQSAELFDPATGLFTSTGSMATGRALHTATLLANGKVLITGGETAPGGFVGTVRSAEIYDPATGSFTPAGNMTTARQQHTATLLSDGRVLIAGGGELFVVPGIKASAEIFDPNTGQFSATGSMSAGRQDHTATLLPNGNVLIAGGVTTVTSGCGILATAELYNPVSGVFILTGSMNAARVGHRATLLQNRSVLIAGGAGLPGCGTFLASAEIYFPGPVVEKCQPGPLAALFEAGVVPCVIGDKTFDFFGLGFGGGNSIPADQVFFAPVILSPNRVGFVLTPVGGGSFSAGTTVAFQYHVAITDPASGALIIGTETAATGATATLGNGGVFALAETQGFLEALCGGLGGGGATVADGLMVTEFGTQFFGPQSAVLTNSFTGQPCPGELGPLIGTARFTVETSGPPAVASLDSATFVVDQTGPQALTHTLTIASTNPSTGVAIAVSPADNSGQSNGTTQFTRSYNDGVAVRLIAPSTAGGNNFSNWTGCDSASGTSCNITMSADRTVTANYVTPVPPPSITSVSPTSGIQGQTITNLTVTGSNFQPTSTLSFSGNPGDFAITYSSRTATQIVASITIAINAAPGARDVIVINPDLQQASLPAAFTVLVAPPPPSPPPSISSVSPTSGSQGQTITDFTVMGNNFQPTSILSFSGSAGDFTITYISRTTTQIVASVSITRKAAVGPRDVVVTNPNLQSAVSAGAFTVLLQSSPKPCNVASVKVDDSLSHGNFIASVDSTELPCQFKITLQSQKFYWTDLATQANGGAEIQQVGAGLVGLLPPATLLPPQPTVSYIVRFTSPKQFVRITSDLTPGSPAYLLNAVQGLILFLQPVGRAQFGLNEVQVIFEAFKHMPHLRAALLTLNPIHAVKEFVKFAESDSERAAFNNLLTQLSVDIDQEIITELLSTPANIGNFVAFIVNLLTTELFGTLEGDVFFTAQ